MRPYDKARDLDAVKRIWREIGWATEDDDVAMVEVFHDAGRTMVHDQDDAAEATCHVARGLIRLQSADLRLAAVTAVTTSLVARRQGAAKRLVANMLSQEAEDGAVVSALGMFDQGFYDMLGFGTGSYLHRFTFDPSLLDVPVPARQPVRVTKSDWAEMHAALLRRKLGNGAVRLDDARLMQAELQWHESPFGLGFRDEAGELTHFIYGELKGEHGPMALRWVCYQTAEQLKELLGVVRSLADQVGEVSLIEPAHVQLQDMVRTPLRDRQRAVSKPFQESVAWWQVRMLDLQTAVGALHFDGPDVPCQLTLSDPIERHLDPDATWRGLAGTWLLTLGADSRCEPGTDEALPKLQASVGPLTRMLFGVRPPSVLANTTDLSGEDDLMARLDRVMHLPAPQTGWEF